MIPSRPYFRRFLILGFGILLIQIIKLHPDWVENLYSRGFFTYLSLSMRAIWGLFPFSIGDLIYLAAIVWLFWRSFKVFSETRYQKKIWSFFIWIIGCIYLIFNVLWGLNYNRNRIDKNLGFAIQDPTKMELIKMVDLCIEKVNIYAPAGFKGKNFDSLKWISTNAYGTAAKQNPNLQLQYFSVKTSLFGKLGNYFGYSGYYNPFSAEGQINMHVPSFTLPYVTCHEIAHQLGYAREDEANFIGFLAARQGDSSAKYSVYFSSLMYANRALFHLDSNLAKNNLKKLSPKVKDDFRVYMKYIQDYQTPLETVVDFLYDHYLKFNDQPMGTVTYSRVVVWMAAYFRKYGEL